MLRPALVLLILTCVLAGCATPNRATLPAAQLLALDAPLEGRILFVKDGDLWLYAEGQARQVSSGLTWRQPQWSPDGREIAYVFRGTNFADVFVMGADGSNSRRLTRSQSASLYNNDWNFRPVWSPNGSQIAYVSDVNSTNPTLWIMNADGTGRHQMMATTVQHDADDGISWAPDGKRLAVASFGQLISQIVIVDVTKPTPQPFTESPNGAIDPCWSPDGQSIAFAQRESGRMDIRVRAVDGSSDVLISQGGFNRAPTWSPDGKRLAFVSSRSGTFEIHVADILAEGGGLVASNERQVTRGLHIDPVSGLSWGR